MVAKIFENVENYTVNVQQLKTSKRLDIGWGGRHRLTISQIDFKLYFVLEFDGVFMCLKVIQDHQQKGVFRTENFGFYQ